jgi:hypothetical protein
MKDDICEELIFQGSVFDDIDLMSINDVIYLMHDLTSVVFRGYFNCITLTRRNNNG